MKQKLFTAAAFLAAFAFLALALGVCPPEQEELAQFGASLMEK